MERILNQYYDQYFWQLKCKDKFLQLQKNLSGEERKGSAPSETLLWPEWVIIYRVFWFLCFVFLFLLLLLLLSDEIGDQEFAKLVL